MSKYSIAIVDDHLLFAESLESLISSFGDFTVSFYAKNGKDFIEKLPHHQTPDIVLLDVKMPVMDGIDTMCWIKENRPDLKVVALSMEDSEETIIRMIRFGARGYLIKDIHPDIFKKAIFDVISKGFYYDDKITTTLLETTIKEDNNTITVNGLSLKQREMEFLKLACSEKTYREIAMIMHLSPKTIDGYREILFDKFEVKNRIGLVIFAIKNKLIKI